VALSVADTGTGMTADVLARAREPFFTTKPEGKGTGLGLAMVSDIVKDCGGCLVIDSTPGAGTSITAYFPAAEPAAQSESDAPAPRAAQAADGSETILLAEDEEPVRDLARRILEARGYVVLSARDGMEALAIEANHAGDIHLLLTDVLMPNLGGPDVAQRLVRRRPAMKVLYMSGFGHQIAVTSRLVGPKTAFLQKPFAPYALALAARDLLNREYDLGGQALAAR